LTLDIRYADDKVAANNQKGLQKLMDNPRKVTKEKNEGDVNKP